MKYQNPFKIIQKENIERFRQIAPDTPAFLQNQSNSEHQNYKQTPRNNSPQFPSFG